MTDVERHLLALLRERCYREGKFTLSSGKESDHYFDAKQLFLSSEGAALIGEVLYERTKHLDIQGIGGLEIGAIPLTTAAVHAYAQHNRTCTADWQTITRLANLLDRDSDTHFRNRVKNLVERGLVERDADAKAAHYRIGQVGQGTSARSDR